MPILNYSTEISAERSVGEIVGYLARKGAQSITQDFYDDGTLPKLASLSGEESEWQIKKDAKVAICRPPCIRLKQRVYMSGFRGWRYFDLEEYSLTSESRHRL